METATAAHTDHHADVHGHEEHHHEETFLTKYIFSQDHKMISKQFLITGIFWGIVGGLLSVLFVCNWVGPMKHSLSLNHF